MRVCFITNRLVLTDGSGRCSVSVIQELQKKGIEVIALSSVGSPKSDLINVKEYKILRSLKNYQAKWFFLILDYIKTLSIASRCDIIHCEIEPFAPLAYLLAKTLNKPYFVLVYGTFSIKPLKTWYLKHIYYQAYANATKVFSISYYTQERFLKEVPVADVEMISRGVDLEKFENFSGERQKSNEQKIILSVGIVKRRKGYHISIPAVGLVAKKYPDLEYLIIGLRSNDEYFLELQQLIKDNNLEKKVKFLQDLTDEELIKLYYRANLFLLTSVNVKDRFEGLGMVHLEANAAGLPAIGTYDCGAQDAIKNGYNGLLVPQNDIVATSEAILKLLDNPALAQQLGQNGKELVKALTWEKVVEKIIRNYELVLPKN
ncbi:MAG: glycosyltransferase family 4 protein [Candidatus Buchananbacteria bacterium]